jgi:UDP-N-acetylglucosamine 3-dehydrogenase
MAEVINTAVIGVGNMGRHHARVYSQMEGINLVAVADPDKKNGQDIARKYNCRYYENYKDMLKKEKIDAISTAVPTSLHKKIAVSCIKKNVPVLIEKPIADTVDAAREIILLSKKRNVPICIGHIERFNPAIQKLKEFIDKGKFGRIISINTKRVGLFPPQIKDTDVIIDLAVHDIDICNFLIGGHCTTVSARAGKALNSRKYDYADIILGYNGIDVTIQVNWITPVKVRELSLTGTKGYAEINYLNQKLKIYKSIYEKEFDSYGDYIVKFGTPEAEELNLGGIEPLRLEIENFLDHVKTGNSNIVTARDGLDSLVIALRASSVAKKPRKRTR